MSDYYWGTLYYVPRDWDGDTETAVETHADFVSHFGKAKALWRLAGREERAAAIERVLERACAREGMVVLDDQDLEELEAAFAGLGEAVVGPVIDQGLRVPTAQLSGLRERFPELDLREGDGAVPETGLGTALMDAEVLGERLRDARARGLHVALDYSR